MIKRRSFLRQLTTFPHEQQKKNSECTEVIQQEARTCRGGELNHMPELDRLDHVGCGAKS